MILGARKRKHFIRIALKRIVVRMRIKTSLTKPRDYRKSEAVN